MIGPFTRVSYRLARLSCGLLIVGPLAACTVRPLPDLHPTPTETALIPADLHLRVSDGASLPVRIYQPQTVEPRGVILALHGYGDSRDAWEFAAPAFTTQGYEIVAPDLRGFGETADRGGWSSTERMVQDAREEIAWIHDRHPGLPVTIMGESMGGAIALLIAASDSAAISNTILLAPAALDIGQPWLTILDGMNALAPNWRLDGSDVPGQRVASDNLAALRRLYFDPLTLKKSTVHALHGLTLLMRAAYRKAPQAHVPLLIIFGGRDQFVLPPFTARLLKQLPSCSRIDELPGAHHLLTRDKRGAAEDAASWLTAPDHPLPSGGDIAAAAWRATAQTDTLP